MRWPLAIAFLFFTGAISGCLSNGSDAKEQTDSPPAQDPLSEKLYDIKDAVELPVTASDGVILDNAVYLPETELLIGAFINFSPYWGDTAMTGGDAFSQYMIEEYVPRGFAVVLSAIRGTGHSGGCFVIGGDRESQDVNEVVDAISKQSWSNGRVAAGGKSYDSTSQNGMIAKYPHEALKGLFHVSGITDMYNYNYHMGVTTTNGAQFTPRYFVTQGFDEYAGATNGAGSVEDENPSSLARASEDARCAELAKHVSSGEGSAATGLKDAYWIERDWPRTIAKSEWHGNIFFVHGLQDWNVKPNHILPWLDEVSKNDNIQVLGWLHQWTQGGTGHVYPMRQDWNETMLRWLDYTLKDKSVGMESLWGYEVQSTDFQWRRSSSWPPTADESIAAAPADLASADESVRISGQVKFRFTATSSTPDPVLTAVITDGSKWVGEAVLRGVLRNSLESPTPITPGQVTEYQLTSYPLDHVLQPGHTLTVTLGATPRQSIVLPSQTTVTYDVASLTIDWPYAPMEPMANQPGNATCFAC